MSAVKRRTVHHNGSLLETLKDNFESFSKARKVIARFLIDHLAEAPLLTAVELARRTNTTSSTVVRFAQNLGYGGFSEMMRAAWDEHMLALTPNTREAQLHFPVEDDFSGRALRADLRVLEETLERNALEDFLAVVERLEQADAIFLAGLHESSLVAGYLHYYLTIMGLPVVTLTSGSEEAVAAFADIGSESLLLAVGFKTAHQFLLRLINAAREAGAITVGVSDNALSEVAKRSDYNLYCYLDSTSFAPSLVGAFSLANALIAALYHRDRRRFDARLARLKRLPLSSDWL